jgi:hypothetical protein
MLLRCDALVTGTALRCWGHCLFGCVDIRTLHCTALFTALRRQTDNAKPRESHTGSERRETVAYSGQGKALQ